MSKELNEILTKFNALLDEAGTLSVGEKAQFRQSVIRKLRGDQTAQEIISGEEMNALLESYGSDTDDEPDPGEDVSP
ncbi:MAG: hypothetical protein ACRBDL_01710 [Alphaproteobacteria bacterium]